MKKGPRAKSAIGNTGILDFYRSKLYGRSTLQVFLGGTLTFNGSQTGLLTNLVSYWTLDEAAGNSRNDSVGTNHLAESAPTVLDFAFIINHGAYSSGTGQPYLSHASNASLQVTSDFTFSLWVRVDDPATNRVFLSKNNAAFTAIDYLIQHDATNGLNFSAGGAGASVGTPATAFSAHHIVAWFDSSDNKLRIRVDDANTYTSAGTATLVQGTDPFAVLAASYGNANWNGLVDEIGFWKRVLTASEITSLYNAGAGLSYGNFTSGGTPNLTVRANKSITAALSFAGGLTRQVAKSITAALGFSGALPRQANKTTGGTLSFSGALSTLVAVIKNLSGSLSFSGGLTKRANKSTGGTLSFVGAITRVVQKAVSGVLTFAGTLTKRANKTVTGTLSFSGALSTLVAIIKNLSGSLGFSGSVSRRANKSTGGTLSFAGAITRSILKSVSGTLSFSGSLSKRVNKSVGGTLSFIGSLIKTLGAAGLTVFAGQTLGGTSTTTRTSGSTTITQSSGESRVEKIE